MYALLTLLFHRLCFGVDCAVFSMKKAQCIVVKDVEALVLRVLCYAGVAPVRLVPLQKGSIASVSLGYITYSKILITLISIAGIVGVIIMQKYGFVVNPRGPFFWISQNIIITSIIAGVGAYYSGRRMTNMINYVNILEKIETEAQVLSYNNDIPTKSKGISKATLLVYLFTYCSIFLQSFSANIFTVIVNCNSPEQFFFLIHEFVYIMKLFIDLQVIYLALKIFITFELINQKLKEMLRANGSDKTVEVSRDIRTLTRSYVSVCDVASRNNKDDGCLMLLMFIDNVHCLILNGYLLFIANSIRMFCTWFHWVTIVFGLIHTAKLLIFIETFHRIVNEANSTRVVVSKLIYHMTGVGKRISIDLDLMYKQLILNEPHYSPLGMFNVRRSIIIAVFSLVTTIAVYLIQLNIPNL